MFPLKHLSEGAIPRALDKAEHYRLLNQPWAAESICLDILAAQPGHQKAQRVLLLALTDQFGANMGGGVDRARAALAQLTSEYERAYYAGIICERRAKAQLDQRVPGAGFIAYELLREAMTWYETAEKVRPEGNDNALLRWNTCVRLLNESPHIVPRIEEKVAPSFGE
jgi:hypothetical protein